MVHGSRNSDWASDNINTLNINSGFTWPDAFVAEQPEILKSSRFLRRVELIMKVHMAVTLVSLNFWPFSIRV